MKMKIPTIHLLNPSNHKPPILSFIHVLENYRIVL